MTYQVLARKWRPSTFDQVLGQNHVIRSLKNSVSSRRLAQSYLLSGTRGIGKTTIARIMAKALRCENLTENNNPCNTCESCRDIDSGSSLDVIEVDGASNNSVENVRELTSTLQYAPTFGEKRVAIIDEVHMLSTSAFNALLKTLEEPPAHVTFIFATTEPNKIPKTVLSRVQQFDLRDIKNSDMKEQLDIISKEEGFTLEGGVEETLCGLANGSMRDLLSIVEQLLLFSEDQRITELTVRESLGIIEKAKVKLLTSYVYQEKLNELVEELRDIFESNIDLEHLVFSICENFYDKLQNALSGNSSEEHFIFESFSKDSAYILNSISPELSFKALMIKLAKRSDYFKSGGMRLKNTSGTQATDVKKEVLESSKKVASENEKTIVKEQRSALEEQSIAESAPVSIEENVELKSGISLKEESQGNESTIEEKTWESFSEWLMEKSPALSSTIEQGNFTTDLDVFFEKSSVILKFEEESSVFYEHIQETDGENKLKKFLSEFFQKDESEIKLNVELIKTNEDKSFKSIANIKEDEYQQTLLERENKLRDSELVKMAQEIFDTKLDKVIPNREI